MPHLKSHFLWHSEATSAVSATILLITFSLIKTNLFPRVMCLHKNTKYRKILNQQNDTGFENYPGCKYLSLEHLSELYVLETFILSFFLMQMERRERELRDKMTQHKKHNLIKCPAYMDINLLLFHKKCSRFPLLLIWVFLSFLPLLPQFKRFKWKEMLINFWT